MRKVRTVLIFIWAMITFPFVYHRLAARVQGILDNLRV